MASYSVLCVRRDTMDNKHFITLVSVLIAIIALAGCIITRHLPLAHKNTKAPTNSRIFDYSFVNLLFDEENGSQIFRGWASHWLTITPARSQHVRGGVCVTLAQNLQLLLSLSARWHCGSQFKRTVLETLAKFGELLNSLIVRVEGGDSSGLTMVWRPARCHRRRNPAADINVTGMSTNSWRTTTQCPDEDSAEEPSTRQRQ